MPIRLQCIINGPTDSGILAWMVSKGTEEFNHVFASDDGYIITKKDIDDLLTGDRIAELVYTLSVDREKKAIFLLDIDLILKNDERTTVLFLKKLEGSSEANEYYEIETEGMQQHLIIETVGRHAEPNDIVGKERSIAVSVLPFELSVFEDIEDLNGYFGFRKPIEIANTGLIVHGLSETFAMPGGMFEKSEDKDDKFSILVGVVNSYRDVRICLGEKELDVVIARVTTALGVVTVAMGRDVFNLEKLRPGCAVGMKGYVKADIAAPGAYETVAE